MRKVEPRNPIHQQNDQARQLSRLQREAANPTDSGTHLFNLEGVDAFNLRHNQHLRFNRQTGKFEPWNPPDIPYGFLDPPVVGDTFAYKFRDETFVTGLSLTAKVAGSSSSILSISKNGSNILTLTLVAGSDYQAGLVTGPGLIRGIQFIPRVDKLLISLTSVASDVVGLGGGVEIN